MELVDAIPQYHRDTKVLPWEKVLLMPIGDIQHGSAGTDLKRLSKHIKWGVDHGALFFGTGDYSDFLSPSNRHALRNAGLYDTAHEVLDRMNDAHMEELKEILLPTRGMWAGLLEGHHYYEYEDGSTTDTRLCQFLEAPFLGTCATVRIPFRDSHSHAVDCLIWGHHGEGGGEDPLRRLLKVMPGFPQIDIFLQGHNTQIDARPKDAIEFYGDIGRLRMRMRQRLLVATGGFMRGYAAGSRHTATGRAQGMYPEKGMMAPTAMGAPVIDITPRRAQDYNYLDLHASV